MARRIVVHGHFYQPPRENPWTGRIEEQPDAAPFHDWNERVHAESYRPNAFATLPGENGDRVVNNFEKLSFNIGPTLLLWMAEADPETYARIIDADRRSRERLGHGNALAQAYHHTILPLGNLRDLRTQVRWGLADFRHRFGRAAEGMWLPETAANSDTLGVLIEEGVGFTILAPGQAGRWRELDSDRWLDVSEAGLETRVPYRYFHRDGSGRSLAVFFYDGDISQAIAFERAGADADKFVDLFDQRSESDDQLVHAATDGETYGHHHPFSELGLAYALFVLAEQRGLEVTNYARFLEDSPPRHEVRIVRGAGTSWSCAHGVRRWHQDCGCSTGGEPGWNQAWRAPLRRGLEMLAGAADEVFGRAGAAVFHDPWRARDGYVDVVIEARELEEFVRSEASGPVDPNALQIAHQLLELQRNAMSMFTSCGWFFSDVAGIESAQVLHYAARTADLMEQLGYQPPEDEVLRVLGEARSNRGDATAADIYSEIRERPTQTSPVQRRMSTPRV
ncbi:MAG TPA: DUF3536 domain-containing protein [Actinomycetota bacterium]|nr:DUF3536 domain-containing protein [Actinomycetota bacterium]